MNQTIFFTKFFTKGLLAGLSQNDKISFPTAEACVGWVRAINAKNAKGRCEFRIVDSSFQSFAR